MVVGYNSQASGSVIDWEQRWSREARRKQLPSLHGIVSKFSVIPGVIGMHGGLPPSDSFPFTSFSGRLIDVGVPDVDDMLEISDPKTVAAAQQYNMQPKGHAPLVQWARDMVTSLHQPATINPTLPPPAAPIGMEIVITQGSSAALDSLCRMLLNPGDPVLLEEYTYAHVVEADLLPLGCELLPIPLDHEGLVPSHLDAIMSSRQAVGLPLPRVLYTIPTGQNPTGSVMSQQRMTEVYDLAQKWDLVIIEDDAYYWLQYPEGPDNVPGLDLRPGFLSLDVDGRVIRIDTLAKLLGPGFRLGWLAAPPAVAAKFGLYTSGISIGANMLSQVMVYEMLNKWGRAGFEGYVRKLQMRYAANAAVAAAAAAESLGNLVEWQPARAGMFMWLKMTGPSADSSQLIEAAAAAQVMVIPGHLISVTHLQAAANKRFSQLQQQCCSCSSSSSSRNVDLQQQQQQQLWVDEIPPSPYFRVSFVSVGPEILKEGFARLAAAIRCCSSSSSGQQLGQMLAAAPAAVAAADCASLIGSAAEAVPEDLVVCDSLNSTTATAAETGSSSSSSNCAEVAPRLVSTPVTPEVPQKVTSSPAAVAAAEQLMLQPPGSLIVCTNCSSSSSSDKGAFQSLYAAAQLQTVDSGSALQPATPPSDAAPADAQILVA